MERRDGGEEVKGADDRGHVGNLRYSECIVVPMEGVKQANNQIRPQNPRWVRCGNKECLSNAGERELARRVCSNPSLK